MKLSDAQSIAWRLIAELQPVCERIEVAGSVRRRKEEVKDIELCVIPAMGTGGLFDDSPYSKLGQYLASSPAALGQCIKGKPEGKYLQYLLPEGVKLDLFVCSPATWGLNFTIRTGSAEFSRAVLTRANRLGYHSSEAQLHHYDGTVAKTPEERSVFDVLKLRWVDPWERTGPEKVRPL